MRSCSSVARSVTYSQPSASIAPPNGGSGHCGKRDTSFARRPSARRSPATEPARERCRRSFRWRVGKRSLDGRLEPIGRDELAYVLRTRHARSQQTLPAVVGGIVKGPRGEIQAQQSGCRHIRGNARARACARRRRTARGGDTRVAYKFLLARCGSCVWRLHSVLLAPESWMLSRVIARSTPGCCPASSVSKRPSKSR